MTRDTAALSARTFDVLVVGGGIYGLTIACDAAQRGLSVALIERDDFGSGSSFNHARTIHGGLRYLQHLDLARSRESIRERRTLARIAPHAVSAVPFVLPLFHSVLKGPFAMRAGLLVDRVVGRDRNEGVEPSRRLPPGRVLSRGEAIERFPQLPQRDLVGAAIWYDYVTLEADRLTFSWALAASAAGAVLANYVDAAALLVDGRRVVGVKAVDRTTERETAISARLTVNATGSSVDHLLAPPGFKSGLRFLKAMNLVTTRAAGDSAIGARSPSGRHFFLVPYRGRALFGTWESARQVSPNDTAVHEADVEAFIAELNQSYPTLELVKSDVSMVHRGVVPAAVAQDGSVALAGRDLIRDHAAARPASLRVDGLISVVGTKYTTARAIAERVVDRALQRLRHGPEPCKTASTPLPGGALPDISAAAAEARRDFETRLPGKTISHVVAGYGSLYREVLELALQREEWCRPVTAQSPVIVGQLVWAARREMVVTLGDAVMRRTPLGAMEFPGDAAVEWAAAIVGGELGWSDERRRAEIQAIGRGYYADQGTLNASQT
jgi:glycerol-3-phosphate dehydrogenase